MSMILKIFALAFLVVGCDDNSTKTMNNEVSKPTTPVVDEKSVEVSKDLLIQYSRNLIPNPQVDIEGITILEEKEVKGWRVLLVNINVEFQEKELNIPETFFVKDGVITGQLFDLETSENYRNTIKPTMPNSFYDEKHLLIGNKNAKHKLVVFSDPQCPFCQKLLPDIFKDVEANPNTLALYYYHLPLLRIHPVSKYLTQIMHIAQTEGRVDIVKKMYELKINARETDIDNILKEVKEQLNYEVNKTKIDTKEILEALAEDEKRALKMMVNGTPTIFIDGKIDEVKTRYKKLIK